MENKEIIQFIPLDKSWIIRMGILDLINGYSDINIFLQNQQDLGRDLKALQKVISVWKDISKFLDVGESGTVYRFVRFYNWKNNINREIKISDTLIERVKREVICDNHKIINFSPEKLLELDNNTSQWASMAYLLGDRRKIKNPPFKLQITYESVEHWEKQRKAEKCWEARRDLTILNQALAFVNLLKTGKINFKPEQAEDYCFARAFNILDAEQGERLFPSLIGHETNRIKEMEEQLEKYEKSEEIDSKDHRVIQAIAMKSFAEEKQIKIKDKCVVAKTWPKFWDFLDYCQINF